ncbi:MAG: hypothetical protein KAI83_19100 [Thiomargarita sp.]|nr:hypothetical protein [Thiomargarita sp.]
MTDLSYEELQKMKEIIAQMEDSGTPQRGNSEEDDEFLQKLEEKAKLFLSKAHNRFYSGDIIQWKKGLRNKRYPNEEQPAYVIQQLGRPITQTEKEPGSPYYQEPLDLELAVLDQEGDLVTFYYDSRRFQLKKGGHERQEELKESSESSV